MKVAVKFFAAAREHLNTDRLEVSLPSGATVAALKTKLFDDHPALKDYALRFAVNNSYASEGKTLHDGDEVACIPPVGGG